VTISASARSHGLAPRGWRSRAPSACAPAELRRHAIGPGEEVQVFLGGEVIVQGELLRHVPELLPQVLRAQLALLARQLHLARARLEEAAEHLDGGRLAGAVGAQKAVDLAVAHLEVDPADGLEVPEGLPEGSGADGHAGVRRSLWAAAGELGDARLPFEIAQNGDERVLQGRCRGAEVMDSEVGGADSASRTSRSP
jgi:hypothetical protein